MAVCPHHSAVCRDLLTVRTWHQCELQSWVLSLTLDSDHRSLVCGLPLRRIPPSLFSICRSSPVTVLPSSPLGTCQCEVVKGLVWDLGSNTLPFPAVEFAPAPAPQLQLWMPVLRSLTNYVLWKATLKTLFYIFLAGSNCSRFFQSRCSY